MILILNQSSGNTPENEIKVQATRIMQELLKRILDNSAEVGRPDPDIRYGSSLHVLSKSIGQVMAEELEKLKK